MAHEIDGHGPGPALMPEASDVGRAQLDPFQRAFVEAPAGSLRLLAPAGSGKTQSLLWRCAELSRRADGKGRFLVVTFTRAARDELRARLKADDFGALASSVDVVTLNSWGWRRVRANHHSPRLLAGEYERRQLVQNTLQPVWKAYPAIAAAIASRPFVIDKVLSGLIDDLKSLGFDHEAEGFGQANDRIDDLMRLGLLARLEAIVDRLHELKILEDTRLETFLEAVIPFWKECCRTMLDQAMFTMEDQKYVAFLDVRRQIAEGRRPTGGSRYGQVLVDEFQDINPLDLALTRAIVELHVADVTLVGDDDQAIFEWRGASPHYILKPHEHFERAFATYVLERNYRCPRNIVAASQRLIVNNTRREPKRVVAMQTVDAEIDVFNAPTFTGSLDAVMAEVRAFVAAQRPGARLAILSRKRAQLIPYQVMMARENIPFCAAEDLQVFLSHSFDKLRHALQACAFARASFRSPTLLDDVLGLCDLVKRWPLKRAERDGLRRHLAAAKPKSYAEALDALADHRGPLKGVVNEDGGASLSFAEAIRRLFAAADVRGAIVALGAGFDGLDQDYGKSQEDIFHADPPFLYLAEYAERYGDDFQTFLDDLEAARETLARLPGEEDDADETWRRPIHLMTALRAKGKEFDTVVMLDVVDGVWPLRRAASLEAREAERRLFYVAMTRAKRRLVLTSSGRIGDEPAIPSPFLGEAGLG
ncbi:UvrD-helicase domain-containing protein [Salinarimonas rosea]|uniref:UvrD-helicase domain-containing protein n=1 Tax=Salinarimonas rosea TaxID=552063 RepID=UPI000420B2F5|nr:ATP-dependent helicase [Salinarimonas rosea]